MARVNCHHGMGQEDDRRKSCEAGLNEHLTSPDLEPLIDLIARSKRQSQCGAVPPKAQDIRLTKLRIVGTRKLRLQSRARTARE
jgi:hypothetical protein